MTFCISYAIHLSKAGETRLTSRSNRPMIGKKISHYKILEELGSGGMGIVYKAEDLNLKRTVALKFVVPRILRKKEDKERFLREAQTAASLNHPHICTIYHIDEVGDNTFIVMEYIEGQSLKEIIGKGPLEPEKALDFAIQIAEGLEEAHEKNIVHRDIKSSNIMVTSKAQAKIMDFGLAKIVSKSQLTETALIMGTVAYMSPEQACGDAIDHRSDIWSLGIVLYEMLSAHVPFQEEHEQLILHSILNKYHEPITDLRSNIPYELERILDKCLEKDPTERYQRADELLMDLMRLKKETESGIIPRTKPIWQKRRVKKLKKLVLPGIFVFVAVILVSGYFLFDWFKPPVRWKASIAVLPMEDWTFQKGYEHICRSTTKDIIFKLTEYSRELRVISFYSMRKYKDSEKEINEIGKELGVDYVLVSSFMSEGQKIRISLELIHVETNRNILPLSQVFELKELFDAQDKISKEIVDELGVHFTESGYIAAKKREPQNIEAYQKYAHGLEIIDNRDVYSDPDEWFPDAIRMLNQALDLDPNYALAHWGIGAAWEAYYVAKGNERYLESAIKHFEKAYELNSELAEANLALGWTYFYKENLEKATESFKRALDISPNSSLINCDVGIFLVSMGLYQSSFKYFNRAIQVEPSYLRAYELSSPCYWYIGEYEKGAELIKKALELEDSNAKLYLELAMHLIMLELFDEADKAIEEAEKISPISQEFNHIRALLFAAEQKKSKALELIQGTDMPYLYSVTCVYALLGMKDEAIENIQLGIEVGFSEIQHYLYSYLVLKENPCYEGLRDDPRFKEIQEKEREIYYTRLNKARDIL